MSEDIFGTAGAWIDANAAEIGGLNDRIWEYAEPGFCETRSAAALCDIMERNGFGNPAVFYNKFRCRFGFSPAEFRRGSRPLKPQSVLTHEDAAEAQKILASHATGLGKAAELAVGLCGTGQKQIVLSAPHNASAN